MGSRSNLLSDLAKAKALFQQRSLLALLNERPAGSKPDQEPRAALNADGKGEG